MFRYSSWKRNKEPTLSASLNTLSRFKPTTCLTSSSDQFRLNICAITSGNLDVSSAPIGALQCGIEMN